MCETGRVQKARLFEWRKEMNDWFEWNGRRCTEYGIHVLEQPPLTLPNERATFVDVPGRSGSLTVLEGDAVYDDLVLTAQCIVENPTRYADIAAYLKGGGKVTFANRPEGYYEARIINQIPFEKIASEDFSAFMRILSLSKLLKNPNNMRGKARSPAYRGTKKRKKR